MAGWQKLVVCDLSLIDWVQWTCPLSILLHAYGARLKSPWMRATLYSKLNAKLICLSKYIHLIFENSVILNIDFINKLTTTANKNANLHNLEYTNYQYPIQALVHYQPSTAAPPPSRSQSR